MRQRIGMANALRILVAYSVDAPALTPAPLPRAGENKRAIRTRGIARDSACERSDALRARAQGLR
ncbi:hypothetical protein CBM2600_B10261 [Cupriavidus taiwanensis]|nr:hypothetical protein CBM2600_B10261 [Cupriavidus taiwanensis]